jgi:hypothetical protein
VRAPWTTIVGATIFVRSSRAETLGVGRGEAVGAAEAHRPDLHAVEFERVEERREVVGPDRDRVLGARRVGRGGEAEAARLPGDQPAPAPHIRTDEVEAEVAGGEASEQDQRLTVAAGVVVPERDAVGLDDDAVARFGASGEGVEVAHPLDSRQVSRLVC